MEATVNQINTRKYSQTSGITIKSPREIELMREAGRVVGQMLKDVSEKVAPGVTTEELDLVARDCIKRLNAKPAFLGYRLSSDIQPFPGVICVSINEEIVHGIPGKRKLLEGDIVSIDAGAVVGGLYGDAAISVPVGRVSVEADQLIKATEEALNVGISMARNGARIGDISEAVQTYAEGQGYSVVREYTGHGIGRVLHEDPQVPNYGLAGRGQLLREGMAICIEPMLIVGDWHTRVLDDQWTVVTSDDTLSAHFEHTMIITNNTPEVLTAF